MTKIGVGKMKKKMQFEFSAEFPHLKDERAEILKKI